MRAGGGTGTRAEGSTWPRRPPRRRLAAALLALLAIVPTAAGAHPSADGDDDRLRRTRSQLVEAQEGLDTVEAQVAATQEQLSLVEASLAAATARLADLEARLAAGHAALEAARARTDQATRKLAGETRQLEALLAELAEREDRFDRRVAATYKYGTVSYADTLVEARSFSDFVTSYHYVRSALDHESILIHEFGVLTRKVRERRAEVDRLRDVAVAEQRAARQARDEIAELSMQQRQVTEHIAADQAERQRALESLERTRHDYEALVSSLQAESDRLAAELRRSRWRAGAAPGAGMLAWPTDGAPGSGFGWRTHPIFGTRRFHSGVDVAGPIGQTIVAAAEGLVVSAGFRGGYGLAVVIDHGGGLATLYAHQSRLTVSDGQIVGRGQRIGEIGSSGYSTGPHLHYEVRVDGQPQDPMRWY